MSNQIVISSGAKVRSLEGVLTGTAGIVNSVPLGGANGVATLDSSGKVPLSQLPASVVTYLGTWNAATNTPTLANGTGDVGDLYICNVAGTVNFGAGPITFAVGDWVIYNGSQWQKSAGQNGTVTSVAVTSTGNDAISITGSPITTAGTINIGFTGTSAQYVNGAGDLTTFPSLTGYVPYTGATTDVDLGVHVLNAQALHVKGTAGAGHLGLKHQSSTATGSANESLIYANVDGDLAWQNDNLYLTTLSTHANTANRVYTFPNASGTLALTSDISYPVTSVFGRTGAVTAQSGDYTTTLVTEGTNLYYTDARARGALSFTAGSGAYNSTTGVITIPTNTNQLTNGANYITLTSLSAGTGISYNNTTGVISSTITQYTDAMARAAISLTTTGTSGAATYNSTTGVLNVPNYGSALSGYVPYTGATADVDLGIYKISSRSLITTGTTNGGVLLKQNSVISGEVDSQPYTSIKAFDTRYLYFDFGTATSYKRFRFDANGLTDGTTITYTMPNASGTLALTSDIPSLANYVTLTGAQTITGIKTFTNEQLFGNGMTLTGGYITYTSGSYNLTLNTNILTANRNVFLQDKAGTIALTSDLTGGTVTSVGLSSATSGVTIGSSPVTTSGTITLAIATASGSQQGLLSSTDWTTFNNKQNALTNPITGTGTSSYHAKFTGSTTLGNSMVSDDGTTLTSAGATRSNLYLKAASTSYYSQLAFTNGSSAAFGGLSYNNSGQYMQFETNSSEWARLTSSGYLGINTTSPNTRLHVAADATYSSNWDSAQFWVTGSDTAKRLQIGYDSTNGYGIIQAIHGGVSVKPLLLNLQGGRVGIETTNTTYATLNVKASGTFLYNGIAIYSTNGTESFLGLGNSGSEVGLFATYGASGSYLPITFSTSGSERMRIKADGTLSINNGVSNAILSINNSGGNWGLSMIDPVSNGALINFKNSSLAQVGSITQNGSATTYATTSDYRLKEDFKQINGLDKLSAIKVYDFKWKGTDKRMDGVIAHELQEIIPYAVVGDKDAVNEDESIMPQGVDYSLIVPVLIKAIQELSAKVTALENK